MRIAPAYRPTLVDPYRDHLRRRRAEEPAVPVTHLLEEIRELGYTGSANLLVRYLNQGRAEGDRPVTTPRHASRLLLTDPENLPPKETILSSSHSKRSDKSRLSAPHVRLSSDRRSPARRLPSGMLERSCALMIPVTASDVRIEASLDPGLSRWMWLVKWLFAIPHYIVLFFLWIGFVLVTVVAFFAILITGRYPRPLFDFNVGVLRWNWRVSYYAHTALGTDRYPPFTLADVPDYPAHFDIAYPERLSRGLVLVKWWLLAIPQYVVVGILAGGWGNDEGWRYSGLIPFLSLVAVIILAVKARYPVHLFDLLLGLARWVARVTAYAALLTDQYPPFRLDMGGRDTAPATTA